MPSKLPNILLNGSTGIAVGMATNIPPHNLIELNDCIIKLIKKPNTPDSELLKILKGPDLPTGGEIILSNAEKKKIYKTGFGSFLINSKWHDEKIKNGMYEIVISEIPFQVNKALVLEKIGDLIRDKTIEGISDLRDESDRNGMRIVIEIKKDIQGDVVLNQLWRHTRLQTSFPVNMLALDNGQPKQMGLIEILKAFIDFRFEVVTRRTKFLLNKSRNRAHILAGLMVAITSIDEVIELIKASSDPENAKKELCAKSWPAKEVAHFIKLIDEPDRKIIDDRYKLSVAQAKAILELRLQRLTGMERSKLEKETEELSNQIKEYLIILSDRSKLTDLIQNELDDVLAKIDAAAMLEYF